MSYQVLARKYRPQRLSDVIGQEHVTRTLRNAIEQGRIAHGYIFSGHRGICKTTIARILAMALNCRSSNQPVSEPCGVCESCVEIREGSVGAMNVIEIDAATNRRIDEVRGIIATSEGQPARGDRYRIFILDEAHQVTEAAFNALLKTLEEPPPWVIFMMATTQPQDIPQTIRSRCQHFSFHAVSFDDILGQLKQIAAKENINFEDDALAQLAEAGDGSMRDALSILDQAIACCGQTLTADTVRELVGTVPSAILEEMLQAVERSSSQDVLRLADKLIREGQNPVHFARQMVRFLRNAMVAKVAGESSELLQMSQEERARAGRVAEMFSEEDLARFLQIMLRTHGELGYKQEQRLHLELGLLKLAHASRLLPIEQLLSEAGATPQRSMPATGGRAGLSSSTERSHSDVEPGRTHAKVSPFASDLSRKSTAPTKKLTQETWSTAAVPGFVLGAAAPAIATVIDDEPAAIETKQTVVSAPSEAETAPISDEIRIPNLKTAVLTALENGGHRLLASMLDDAEWTIRSNELVVSATASQSAIDVSFSAEARKIAQAAAAQSAGKMLKIHVRGGASSNGEKRNGAGSARSAGENRSRAAQEPVVKRMKEKFGAEIRTIIDHRNKH